VEGLGYSGPPCTTGLSVAGFLVILGRFLPSQGFILRVKEASFLTGIPTRVDVRDNTVGMTDVTARVVYTVSMLACTKEGVPREA